MLTTSTESSPSPSRRLLLSSRLSNLSPVSYSSKSMSVWRMNARSFIGVTFPGEHESRERPPRRPAFHFREVRSLPRTPSSKQERFKKQKWKTGPPRRQEDKEEEGSGIKRQKTEEEGGPILRSYPL